MTEIVKKRGRPRKNPPSSSAPATAAADVSKAPDAAGTAAAKKTTRKVSTRAQAGSGLGASDAGLPPPGKPAATATAKKAVKKEGARSNGGGIEADKAEKAGKADKAEVVDKVDKVETVDKAQMADKADEADRADKAHRVDYKVDRAAIENSRILKEVVATQEAAAATAEEAAVKEVPRGEDAPMSTRQGAEPESTPSLLPKYPALASTLKVPETKPLSNGSVRAVPVIPESSAPREAMAQQRPARPQQNRPLSAQRPPPPSAPNRAGGPPNPGRGPRVGPDAKPQLPPNYNSTARKITTLMVGIPFAIVLSYHLYGRLYLGVEQKKLVHPEADPAQPKTGILAPHAADYQSKFKTEEPES
ncbi:hypothetical protein BDY21DRAFT_174165 [Lineolata rhizophorae]|uniref:Uncharacterized protein n=1 Tax=Lineolata rhizophorae TaxID=578093 RepID=A0A6A6NLX2_9PEZI|nr:hypothetical protein BDY21DRAFT_174165 [Lineolata rhizophorae]